MDALADAESALLDWQAEDAEHAQARFRFPAELPVFIGHFPGQPLVPGIYSLAAAIVCCRHWLERPQLDLRRIARCKWTAPLLPEQLLSVAITRKQSEAAALQVSVTLQADGVPSGSCTMDLGEPVS